MAQNLPPDTDFPQFSLENRVSPKHYLESIHHVGQSKGLSEDEMVKAVFCFTVGIAKEMIDLEPSLKQYNSWRHFCRLFLLFFRKQLELNNLIDFFEKIVQKPNETVSTYASRLQFVSELIRDSANHSLYPAANKRAIERDLLRLFVNGLHIGKDDIAGSNPASFEEAVERACDLEASKNTERYPENVESIHHIDRRRNDRGAYSVAPPLERYEPREAAYLNKPAKFQDVYMVPDRLQEYDGYLHSERDMSSSSASQHRSYERNDEKPIRRTYQRFYSSQALQPANVNNDRGYHTRPPSRGQDNFAQTLNSILFKQHQQNAYVRDAHTESQNGNDHQMSSIRQVHSKDNPHDMQGQGWGRNPAQLDAEVAQRWLFDIGQGRSEEPLKNMPETDKVHEAKNTTEADLGAIEVELSQLENAARHQSVRHRPVFEEVNERIQQILIKMLQMNPSNDEMRLKHYELILRAKQFRSNLLLNDGSQEQPSNERYDPQNGEEESLAETQLRGVARQIDELHLEVDEFLQSNDKSKREFLYLDDKITRIFLKLDEIDSDGRTSIRTQRKALISEAHRISALLKQRT